MEANALAGASILLFSNLLNVMMPFKSYGALVITVYRMFVGGERLIFLIHAYDYMTRRKDSFSGFAVDLLQPHTFAKICKPVVVSVRY